jgi:serine/threonine-protein kinase PRP4
MGLPYGYPIDMWSVGCCIYEIYTGRILFPGRTNNDMLYRFMEVSGPFPKKLLKKGEFVSQYFDDTHNFKRVVKDQISNKVSVF